MFQVLGGFLGDFDKASATRRTSIQAVAGDMVWGCGGWKTRHTAAKPTKTITQQPATGIAQSARRINRLGRSIAQPTHNIACPTRSIGKPDRGTRKPQGSKKQLACCVGYGSAAKPDTAGGYRGVGAGAAKDGMGSPVVHLLKRCAKRMHSFFQNLDAIWHHSGLETLPEAISQSKERFGSGSNGLDINQMHTKAGSGHCTG